MVSTPEEITYDSLSLPMIKNTVKKPSDRKSLHLFINISDIKRELLSVVLDLQTKNSDPLDMYVSCERKKPERALKNQ